MKQTTKNILKGIGSVIDLYPVQQGKYTIQPCQQPRSDADALASDWQKVGHVLSEMAIKEVAHETETK